MDPTIIDIEAPSSKSYTHRALMVEAYGEKKGTIINPLECDDTKYTIDALRLFGNKIYFDDGTLVVKGMGDKPRTPDKAVDAGESGTTLRFMTGYATLCEGIVIIRGNEKRPIGDLGDALSQLNVFPIYLKKTGYPPFKIYGGKVKGGKVKISGAKSSQFVSSLLMRAPLTEDGIKIEIKDELKSAPYVDMTIEVLNKAGIKVENKNHYEFYVAGWQEFKPLKNYRPEGDYSLIAPFLARAAIYNEKIRVKNLEPKTKQGDVKILEILADMGCSYEWHGKDLIFNGGELTAPKRRDMSNNPDIAMSIAAVTGFAKGTTRIENIGHLREKESDRIRTTRIALKRLGIDIKEVTDYSTKERKDYWIINGNPKLNIKDAVRKVRKPIPSGSDHRIAMLLRTLGVRENMIEDYACIRKSWPDFTRVIRNFEAGLG